MAKALRCFVLHSCRPWRRGARAFEKITQIGNHRALRVHKCEKAYYTCQNLLQYLLHSPRHRCLEQVGVDHCLSHASRERLSRSAADLDPNNLPNAATASGSKGVPPDRRIVPCDCTLRANVAWGAQVTERAGLRKIHTRPFGQQRTTFRRRVGGGSVCWPVMGNERGRAGH